MRLFLDNDTDVIMDFDYEKIAKDVINASLKALDCPFEVQINLLLTDNETIRTYNRDSRDIDRATDVLSFPGLEFDEPGVFELNGEEADYIDPETGLVVLGDIIISLDKVSEQAAEYGHSELREYAFLIAHSMLHLSGFDHMTSEEAADMEARQESILEGLHISRDRD